MFFLKADSHPGKHFNKSRHKLWISVNAFFLITIANTEQSLKCARVSSKHFTHTGSLNSHHSLCHKFYFTHFTDKKVKERLSNFSKVITIGQLEPQCKLGQLDFRALLRLVSYNLIVTIMRVSCIISLEYI